MAERAGGPFFNQQVRRELFSKLVTGVLVVLAVEFGKTRLQSAVEDARAREAVYSRLVDQSVAKIAEVSSAIGETENAVRLFLWSHDRVERAKARNEPVSEEDLERLKADEQGRFNHAKDSVEKFLSVLSRNRFWLGERAYRNIHDHVAVLRDELRPGAALDLARMEARMERSRPTLQRIVPAIREELRSLK